MATYSDIIARLENATGPDRWLDADIDAFLRIGSEKMLGDDYKWAWKNFPLWKSHPFVAGMCGLSQSNGSLGMIWDSRPFTASLDEAIALVKRMLPGWGWRVATCCVSDDAYVFPDFNSPERGQDLLDRLPVCPDGENEWSNFTDVDQRPPGRPAIALLTAMFIALEEIERIGEKP